MAADKNDFQTFFEGSFDASAVHDGDADLHLIGHRVRDEVAERTFFQTTFRSAAVDVLERLANGVVHLKRVQKVVSGNKNRPTMQL